MSLEKSQWICFVATWPEAWFKSFWSRTLLVLGKKNNIMSSCHQNSLLPWANWIPPSEIKHLSRSLQEHLLVSVLNVAQLKQGSTWKSHPSSINRDETSKPPFYSHEKDLLPIQICSIGICSVNLSHFLPNKHFRCFHPAWWIYIITHANKELRPRNAWHRCFLNHPPLLKNYACRIGSLPNSSCKKCLQNLWLPSKCPPNNLCLGWFSQDLLQLWRSGMVGKGKMVSVLKWIFSHDLVSHNPSVGWCHPWQTVPNHDIKRTLKYPKKNDLSSFKDKMAPTI